jgi:hypothetical protein
MAGFNKRKQLIGIVAIALAVLACRLPVGGGKPTPMIATAAVVEPAVKTSTTPAQPTAVTDIHYSEGNLKTENADPHYTIDVLFPIFLGQDGFNIFEVKLVNDMAQAFVEQVAALQEAPAAGGTFSSLQARYTVHAASGPQQLVSVEMQVSQYLVGAAHPNAYTVVINYDLAAARQLQLADLLAPGGVDFLSKFSTHALQKSGELEWAAGSSPAPENFQNWNFDEKGLVITFDPYQVGSYAAGFHKVMIPYADLEPYMTADSPVRKMFSEQP